MELVCVCTRAGAGVYSSIFALKYVCVCNRSTCARVCVYAYIHAGFKTDTHRQTHTDTQTETHTDTDTETDRQTDTHTWHVTVERDSYIFMLMAHPTCVFQSSIIMFCTVL